MNKIFCFILLFGTAFPSSLYRPHILRTMRGEMVLSENSPVVGDTIQPQIFYDPDTIKVPGLKSVKAVYAGNICWTIIPPLIGTAALPLLAGSESNGLPMLLIMASFGPALFLGPSSGLFYAGQWSRGFISAGIRASIVIFSYCGGMALLNSSEKHDFTQIPAYVLIASGITMYFYTWFKDTDSSCRAVEEYNKKLRLEFFRGIKKEQEKVGLGLSWRF